MSERKGSVNSGGGGISRIKMWNTVKNSRPLMGIEDIFAHCFRDEQKTKQISSL